MTERIEIQRTIAAPAPEIFALLCDPHGHVAIDASGMLQDFTGEPAEKVGDTFVIHMDRESLNDFPLGQYDVTVHIIAFERDQEIARDLGPDIGIPHFYGYRLEAGEDGVTNVTTYYDWSKVEGDRKERFPVVPESALRATLGILDRTVRKGLYARARAGQLPGFTGIDSAYEVPLAPELVLGTEVGSLSERVSRVLELLESLLT